MILVVASMLRSGAIERALKERAASETPTELGNLLGKQSRLRDLTLRQWKLFFKAAKPDRGDRMARSHALENSRKDHAQLLGGWLQDVDRSVDLALQHKVSHYEEPLIHVLLERNRERGSRLQGQTPVDIQEGRYGFFRKAVDQDLQLVTYQDGKVVTTGLTDEKLDAADDWRIENPCLPSARIHSTIVRFVHTFARAIPRREPHHPPGIVRIPGSLQPLP